MESQVTAQMEAGRFGLTGCLKRISAHRVDDGFVNLDWMSSSQLIDRGE
jgi:hypothetical protein